MRATSLLGRAEDVLLLCASAGSLVVSSAVTKPEMIVGSRAPSRGCSSVRPWMRSSTSSSNLQHLSWSSLRRSVNSQLSLSISLLDAFLPKGKVRPADKLQGKAARILPLVGLARSKQDLINLEHGAQYLYRPPPSGPLNARDSCEAQKVHASTYCKAHTSDLCFKDACWTSPDAKALQQNVHDMAECVWSAHVAIQNDQERLQGAESLQLVASAATLLKVCVHRHQQPCYLVV